MEQTDTHLPTLTVRETLEFAHNVSSSGDGLDAAAGEGKKGEHKSKVDEIIEFLDLQSCEHTILGALHAFFKEKEPSSLFSKSTVPRYCSPACACEGVFACFFPPEAEKSREDNCVETISLRPAIARKSSWIYLALLPDTRTAPHHAITQLRTFLRMTIVPVSSSSATLLRAALVRQRADPRRVGRPEAPRDGG